MGKDIQLNQQEENMEQSIHLKKYTCERCGHAWIPRKLERPRLCPKCNSAWWDVPKEEDDKE